MVAKGTEHCFFLYRYRAYLDHAILQVLKAQKFFQTQNVS